VAATAVLNTSTLLKILRENSLVDEDKLTACLKILSPDEQSSEDAQPLADALVEQRLLTRFQANLLLQGKSKSLRITSKYRLLDRLGAGGMGLVYLCEHIRMKRLVALKVLPNSQAKEPGNLERFFREAQAVAALKHNNIVQAYDVDSDNGIHYLVMEFVDGINLEKLIVKHGPIDSVRAAHYIAQAADGLQHAHERGLVHRDIKPSNLLVDREGYIKILDMGLARFFDTRADNITQQFDDNAVIGTADFISPEQALNSHDVDIRADIYSLGCTLYYLLAGRAPYHDANITQKLLLHQLREPTALEKYVPMLDPDLKAIVRKMMAKKPEDRYQIPGEVAAALTPWTEQEIPPPAEIPVNPLTGLPSSSGSTVSNSSSSKSSKKAPKPSRGMETQRISGSSVNRRKLLPLPEEMDEDESEKKEKKKGSTLRSKKHHAPKKKKSSKLRYILGALACVAVFVGVFLATRSRKTDEIKENEPPLHSNPTPVDKEQVKKNPPIVEKEPEKKKTPPPPAKSLALGSGFVAVKMDAKTPRPAMTNGQLRTDSSTVMLFWGADLGKNSPEDAPLLDALRPSLVGGKAGGPANAAIIPYAVAGNAAPNAVVSFVTITDGLRPLAGAEFAITADFTNTTPEQNVLVKENANLPKGVTTVNSLITQFKDLSAAEGGSTLNLASGAILCTTNSNERSFIFGAGKNPLTLDGNGRTIYVTLGSDQDFTKPMGGREYIFRAKFTNVGADPLVISGLAGNILRLDQTANANSRLVIQGLPLAIKDKLFRVAFTADGNLGVPKGAVSLSEAALYMTGLGPLEIDRPLQIAKPSQLAVTNVKAVLTWTGKISGAKLTVVGPGQLVLKRRDNDLTGGIDVNGGSLVLAGEGGPVAGMGNVTVLQGGTLTGTGIIAKDLIVRGGLLQPGSAQGKPLTCDGKLVLERYKTTTGKPIDKPATVRFVLADPKTRPLIYTKPPALDFTHAVIQFSVADSFKPTKESHFVLIDNRPKLPVKKFQDADQSGTIKSTDGKWTAKITYVGNASSGAIDGGFDVMLYDFTPFKP